MKLYVERYTEVFGREAFPKGTRIFLYQHSAVARDLDKASENIVEVELVASVEEIQFVPGGPLTEVWTYNGTIPGPTIEANVGDTLIVHFRNELPEESTIHWHGLELPANMDGSNILNLPIVTL